MRQSTDRRFGSTLCLLVFVLLNFGGCGGGGNHQLSSPPPPSSGGLPASFFGIHVNHLSSFPLQVPSGEFRVWDSEGSQWPDIETCQAASGSPNDPCLNWGDLDLLLSNMKQADVSNIFYTLSRTPAWASQNISDSRCNYYVRGSQFFGACYPPTDLNADGTGSNQIWKNWLTAVATRVNDPTYLQSHAQVKYWETWNEFNRSQTIENWQGSLSWQGTYNQLVRLAEDARCIITGKGTIHNVPTAGQSTACSLPAIDPNAIMVAPSHSISVEGGLDAIQNFLYCNRNPRGPCTVGDAGAQAVDIINPHLYAQRVTPEVVISQQIPALRRVLQASEQQKPLWNGEGSWGSASESDNVWHDPFARAGFIPRFFALYKSANVAENFWYGYDLVGGQLYDPTSGQLLNPEATAWKETYQWLVGASAAQTPFCRNSGTIYTCDFMKSNGNVAQLVWDSQYGQNCSQMANPVICGNTLYSVPSKYNQD